METAIERYKKAENKKKAQIELGKLVNSMISSGYTNKEIGAELGLPESKVRLLRETLDK